MKFISLVLGLVLASSVAANEYFVPAVQGDHYVFFPEEKAGSLLIVAHGMIGKNEKASDVAYRFLSRWKAHAIENNAVLIVPVFDTARFGNLKGGYGGYRNLLGRHVGADDFINQLADTYSEKTTSKSNKFYLYGHSAGGQFVSRYTVRHPDRVLSAVVSAAGRYSYPTKDSKWPYGAGYFSKRVVWVDGTSQYVKFEPDLSSYAKAAQKLDVVVGSKDTSRQPVRPAHIGKNRIEFAKSWAAAMNENAAKYGRVANVAVHIVDGVGHNSSALTKKSVAVLFGPET